MADEHIERLLREYGEKLAVMHASQVTCDRRLDRVEGAERAYIQRIAAAEIQVKHNIKYIESEKGTLQRAEHRLDKEIIDTRDKLHARITQKDMEFNTRLTERASVSDEYRKDHETRMRLLEQKVWYAAGIAAASGAVIMFVLQRLIK